MKKKVAILITDGIGLKNYGFSNIFENFYHESVFFHYFEDEVKIEFDENIKQKKLIPYIENLTARFLRELIHLSRLKFNAKLKTNNSILTNYRPKKKNLKEKIFYSSIESLSNLSNKYDRILFYEKYYQKIIRKSKVYKFYKQFFEANNYSKVFCTHQRAIIAAPIFAAAKDAGVKTITAIYSWDNLPKARLALKADEYIVWSPYMANELKTFYPEIENSQIKVLGTPQFEIHYNPKYAWSKEKFCAFYGLDADKKWLCFSGDDKITSPFDPLYLEDIAETISSSDLKNEWQILLRPVPAEGFSRYEKVIQKYPELIIKTGASWKLSKDWSNALPEVLDLYLLRNLCHFANAVINIGSTMALDFAMHDKPSIYINYEVDSSTTWSVKQIYNFQHFRSMKGLEPVIWLNSKQDILHILKNLENYHLKTKEDMRKWCEIIIPNHVRHNSSNRIQNHML